MAEKDSWHSCHTHSNPVYVDGWYGFSPAKVDSERGCYNTQHVTDFETITMQDFSYYCVVEMILP